VIHVDLSEGSNRNTGESWKKALAGVQRGVDLAGEGGGCEVWVAAGTYLPTVDATGSARPDDPRDKTVKLRKGVSLLCGFKGDETAAGKRNPEKNVTILDGDIGISGDDSDNAYHVVTGTDDAIIDGCVVTGGNADGAGDRSGGGGMFNKGTSPRVVGCTFRENSAAIGGGMSNQAEAAPLLKDCLFDANTATNGGGMFNQAASPTVKNCRFENNTAEGQGGGMKNDEGADAEIRGCTFTGNVAPKGGAMVNTFSAPLVSECLFTENGTSDPVTGNLRGGAIYNEEARPVIADSTFRKNAVNDAGGAICNIDAYGAVRDCAFEENEAVEGGGIYNLRAAPSVKGCTFSKNRCGTAGRGCGIFNKSAVSTIVDCRFELNQAHQGAGLFNHGSTARVLNGWFDRNTAFFRGGAIYNHNSESSFINLSVGNNNAEYGSALFNYSNAKHTVTVRNTVVWGNVNGDASSEQVADEGSVVTDIGDESCVEDLPGETCDPAWDNKLALGNKAAGGAGCIGAADATLAPHTDVNGKCRGDDPDLGAIEFKGQQCDRDPICGEATGWPEENGGEGQKYWYCPKLKLAWDDAAAYCNSLDAHLAAITSGNEHMFVQTVIYAEGWMGARHTADGWTWSDGSPWSDREEDVFWSRGVDLENPRECAVVTLTNEWNDGDCDQLKAFVCEWNER
jgi:hypothetical protein